MPRDAAECAEGSRQEPDLPDTPNLDAWRISGNDVRIVVGKWFNDPRRIEIDPNDLISDPDAGGHNDTN